MLRGKWLYITDSMEKLPTLYPSPPMKCCIPNILYTVLLYIIIQYGHYVKCILYVHGHTFWEIPLVEDWRSSNVISSVKRFILKWCFHAQCIQLCYHTCCSSRVKHLEGHILNIPVHTNSKRKVKKMRKLIGYF